MQQLKDGKSTIVGITDHMNNEKTSGLVHSLVNKVLNVYHLALVAGRVPLRGVNPEARMP